MLVAFGDHPAEMLVCHVTRQLLGGHMAQCRRAPGRWPGGRGIPGPGLDQVFP